MFPSVVIPTYNRRPILEKCLLALEKQVLSSDLIGFEILIVDDGSTDGTCEWLRSSASRFPHVRLIEQDHAGPAAARNKGVVNAQGDVIVFIDSDLVVTEYFLASHSRALRRRWRDHPNRLCFTYGAVINTSNFERPTDEPHKLSDLSWAYFATGNVAIDKAVLERSGLFDTSFCLYGWEDLELGERLRKMGVALIKCPEAVGYHWHPPLSLEKIPNLIRVEKERAKMGLLFYKKHPTLRVRFIIQFTSLHLFLWEVLTLGGLLNVKSLKPLLKWLIATGHPGVAMELLRLPLNRIGVRELYKEASLSGLR